MDTKRLLAVWAHPDDEAFGPVGTMRPAHDRGWHTAVMTATRGDAGNSKAVLDVRAYEPIKRQVFACHASQRADWERLLGDRDWLTTDRFFRAFPPLAPDERPETTICDE